MKAEVETQLHIIADAMQAITQTIGIEHTVATARRLAACFCELDDDCQAQFFVEVARLMDGWGIGKRDSQAWYIGRHLATCECATPEAREFVSAISAAAEHHD